MSPKKIHVRLVEQDKDLRELLKDRDGNVPLDIDLNGLSADTEDEGIDINLASDIIPLSSSHEMVPSNNSHDFTVRTSKKLLAKMGDSSTYNVYQLQKKRIIHPEMDDYSILNSFREIRTHLLQKSKGKNFVLLITSLAENVGATFTTVNLAAAFSFEGEKTSLVVDCNLKESKIHTLFEQEISHGLTDYLFEPAIGIDKIIYPSGLQRMRFIPIGSKKGGGVELLSSHRLKEVVIQLKRRFADRFIFLNAPPLENSADAAILSEVADFVAVVLPYGKATKRRIRKATKLIPKDKLVGYIINNKKSYV